MVDAVDGHTDYDVVTEIVSSRLVHPVFYVEDGMDRRAIHLELTLAVLDRHGTESTRVLMFPLAKVMALSSALVEAAERETNE